MYFSESGFLPEKPLQTKGSTIISDSIQSSLSGYKFNPSLYILNELLENQNQTASALPLFGS